VPRARAIALRTCSGASRLPDRMRLM
jgi:hypothetical protein